jgi:hypothetical protein
MPAERLYTAEHQATILFACISQAIQAILQQGRPLYLLPLILCHIESSDRETRTQNYTACLWFLKGLSKKKQAKVVRQAEIKTSVSDTFHLNVVLKATKQMCEKEESECVA